MSWHWLQQWASLKNFYALSQKCFPWLSWLTALLFLYGLYGALWKAPADYQQGDAFRIMYIHVPSAFLSLMIYGVMSACAFVFLVWRIKLADIVADVSASIGLCFTFLALITGSIWGKPMWGTWWIWDARLTSELILFFIYLAIIALQQAIPNQQQRARAIAIVILIGSVDLPIIHYSVYWWNTLHQGQTLRLFKGSLIAPEMLTPLLIMIAAFIGYYSLLLLWKSANEILWRERKTDWVKQILLKEETQ